MTTHTPEEVRDGLARCFFRNEMDRPSGYLTWPW